MHINREEKAWIIDKTLFCLEIWTTWVNEIWFIDDQLKLVLDP